MRLPDYLKRERLTQAEFGRRLNPPMTQAGLSHVINGRTRISLERALEINKLTNGEVGPEDWLESTQQEKVA